MAREKKRKLRQAAREMTGARAASRLAQRSQAEDPDDVNRALAKARDLFLKMSKYRKVSPELVRDPLGSLRIYEELRDEGRSSKVELTRTNRPNLNQPYIAEVRLDSATLVTTVLMPLFAPLLDVGKEELTEKEMRDLASDFAEIRKKFGDKTLGRLQDALKFRAVNLGGPVSRAYAQLQRETSKEATADELAEDENARIADFLDIFSRIPGHSKISTIPGDPNTPSIEPEAAFIPLTRRAELLDKIIADPNMPPQQKARILEQTQKIYIPLAVEWRKRAFDENKPDLAATFNALKTLFKDKILQIKDPEGYQITANLILKMVQAIAPERAHGEIKNLHLARAFVLAPMADEIHTSLGLLRDRKDPRDMRDLTIVQARIKSVFSTYDELKWLGIDVHTLDLRDNGPFPRVLALIRQVPSSLWKTKDTGELVKKLKEKGIIIREDEKPLFSVFHRLRDVLGFRAIKRITASPDDSEEKKGAIEAKEISQLHDGLKQIIKDNGVFVYEDGREFNLYDAEQRDAFFKKSERQDNGYRTVQDGMRYLGIAIEEQCRSEDGHGEAELGKSAHDLYKDGIKAHTAEKDKPPDTSSPIFTDVNEIKRVGKGGTVADFLAEYYRNSIDPALAFSTASIKIVRQLHYFDPELIPAPADNDFSAPLMPGDRIVCTMDTERRYDPRQREAVIAACKLRDSSEYLKSLHIDLALNEASRPPNHANTTAPRFDT